MKKLLVLSKSASRVGLCLLFATGLCTSAVGKPTYTSFDPTGSIYTLALSINDLGVIVGQWQDSSDVVHGFIRAADGTLTSIDPPKSIFSYAAGINTSGVIAGVYRHRSYVNSGYVRATDGTFTSFDAPGAGKTEYQGTWPTAINDDGTITGYYIDASANWHGFVRTTDGTVTNIDPPGSTFTWPRGINSDGTIVGSYNGENGFARSSDGTFTTLHYGSGASAWAINDTGSIVGEYTSKGGESPAFIRTSDGKKTAFFVRGSRHGQGTTPVGINSKGTIVGVWEGPKEKYGQGSFIRKPDGTIAKINVPFTGASSNAAEAINGGGTITGYWVDSSLKSHGFLRTP